MYGPTDLKKNVLITLDGQPYKVVEYSQKVMGRGGSIVNVKVKNLITGALLPKTFKGQEKIEPAEVTTKKVQYLYKDDEKFYFMDPSTFEQYELAADMVGDSSDYMKDGDEMEIPIWNYVTLSECKPIILNGKNWSLFFEDTMHPRQAPIPHAILSSREIQASIPSSLA